MPALAEAAHNISLGIYWRLSKQYEKERPEADPYKLAYAVVYDLTQNGEGTRSLGDFPTKYSTLIANEVWRAGQDEAIRRALSLEYAGRLMAISWNSGSPLSAEYFTKAAPIMHKASDLGIKIENIVSLWGTKAIINLQAFSKAFRKENV